jgi:hypothetical protein
MFPEWSQLFPEWSQLFPEWSRMFPECGGMFQVAAGSVAHDKAQRPHQRLPQMPPARNIEGTFSAPSGNV